MTGKWQRRKPARIGVAAGVLVAVFLLGWLARGFLTRPHDAFTIADYGQWRLSCPPQALADSPCVLSQNVTSGRTHAVIMRFTLWLQKGKRTIAMLVPQNVLLPNGIGLRVGAGPPQHFDYKTCDRIGCLATVSVDRKLYDSIVGATQLGVVVVTLDGKSNVIALSTKGLSKGARAMRDAESRRHSWLRRAFL